jgi:multiple sugar transport system substrate-binding protein
VGVPTGASQWVGEVARQMDEVDAKYRNVPLQNFKGYEEGTRRLANVPEPPSNAQQVYHFLDGVIQVVLTQRDADPRQQLDQAARQADVILAAQ